LKPLIAAYQVSDKLGQPEIANDIEITINNRKQHHLISLFLKIIFSANSVNEIEVIPIALL
jgi:hypothetical protein